jgi:hypothetical protein
MTLAISRRSSAYNDMSEASRPPRRFLPEPIETTTKSHRRFPVEALETTSRSNRIKDEERQTDNMVQPDPPPKKRFVPELIETSTKSNKPATVRPTPELTPEPSPRSPPADKVTSPTRPRRRFAPQLIETTRRSKKAGDTRPATLPNDKTDITPGTNHIYVPRQNRHSEQNGYPLVPGNTPAITLPYMPNGHHMPSNMPRRQGSMKPHLNTRRSTRQNSFQPELESILSDDNSDDASPEGRGGEGEQTPSLTDSFGSSDGESLMKLQLARTRESCDDRFSGYLLELAAEAAEKQLREQAEAAFINSDFHEGVEHFLDEVDTSSDDEETFGIGLLPHEMLDMHPVRRKSTEVGWAAREMQQHQQHLAKLREEETHRLLAAEASQPTFADPFWTNGMTLKNGPVDKVKEAELERMRNAASPPMLGADLVFRKCPSPKATKFETDQRINVVPKRHEDGGGLWGGYCVADDESQFISPAIRGPPLLATPANEREDPFSTSFGEEVSKKSRPGSPTPGRGGVHLLSGLDERLKAAAAKSKLEEAYEQEFDDKFVTQVYNYLSLGYPSLARQYDEELSKISRVPEDELCKDDLQSDVKGHIGLEQGETTAATGVRCARWTALRIYILEWARQHPGDMSDSNGPSAWGVRARRGSWAI